MPQEINLLTIKEASRLLKVHPNTLRHWDKEGSLKAIRLGRGNRMRYRRQDLDRMLDPTRELLVNIADKMPAMVAAYNISTGQYIYVNHAVYSLLGYTPQEFIKGGL